jgi:hypothetical protein
MATKGTGFIRELIFLFLLVVVVSLLPYVGVLGGWAISTWLELGLEASRMVVMFSGLLIGLTLLWWMLRNEDE